MKKVSLRDLVILAIALAAFSIFVIPRVVFRGQEGRPAGERKMGQVYYCPMHPAYVSDRPGDCPICNMKLVPKPDAGPKRERKILYYRHPMGQPDTSPVPKKDSMGMDYIPVYEDEMAGQPSEVPGHAQIRIPAAKQQLMGVKLGTAVKTKLTQEIRTSGRVAYDPELFTAQQEFLSAVKSLTKARGGPYHEPLARSEALLDSSKTRLRLLGMSENEIEELEKKTVQDRSLILPESQSDVLRHPESLASTKSMTRAKNDEWPGPPPDDGIWVYAAVYEYELSSVQIGSRVRVKVPTFPDREFSGEVRAAKPVLDPATRSIQVRARVLDPEGLLKPEMYVDLYLAVDRGEVVAVPEEAVMHTGERDLVFVSPGEGLFEPREVTLGAKAGNLYEVKTGLAAGESIAVSGNFLIDSESRLQSALQGMTREGEGHAHG